MTWLRDRSRVWRRRARTLLRKDAVESELDEEVLFHLRMEEERNRRSGMTDSAARHAAFVAFGGVERFKEEVRESRRTRLVEDALADGRYGLRTLRKKPGFAAAAVLTLALGIGAATAVFSVAYGVIFRSLPYDDPEELVRVSSSEPASGGPRSMSPPNFMSLREENRSLEDVAIFDSEDLTLTGRGMATLVEGSEVSAGFFEVMGVRPVAGRTFREGENLPGSDGIVVISHALWQAFGGNEGIVGQTLVLNARPRVVVGVLPAGFDFPYDSDAWIPIEYSESWYASNPNRRSFWLNAVARLRGDVTPAAARNDLAELSDRLRERFPEDNRDVDFAITPMRDALIVSAKTSLLVLLAAVGLLLLIACANVAGLLFARATSRRDELALRAAIGAGRGRLLRQLLAESLVVGLLAGTLGLLLAVWTTHLIVNAPPAGLPRVDGIRVDGAVLGFSVGVTLVTVVLAGFVPAWRSTRAAVASHLREGGGGRSVVRGNPSMRAGLVATELALSVVLLTCAGLLLKSFASMLSVDPGFRTEHGLTFQVRLPDTYETGAERSTYFETLLERLAALPGVDGAAAVHRMPMAWNGFSTRVEGIEGREPPRPDEAPSAIYRRVTPGYFELMGIPVLRGRAFTRTDRDGAARVAVINRTAAHRFFDGADPIGMRIRIGADPDSAGPLTIVGIVGDVVDQKVTEVQEPEIFLAHAQAAGPAYAGSTYMSMVVRSSGDPLALLPAIRGAIETVDPNVLGREFTTLEQVVRDSMGRERFLSLLMAMFAGAALLLAAIGVFGLFSFTVAERTREIAVRTALGARRHQLVGMVLQNALGITGIGLAIGLGAAVFTTRLLESQLYGVRLLDPVTFGGVIVLLALTAVLASLLPALRAATVDPMAALRRE